MIVVATVHEQPETPPLRLATWLAGSLRPIPRASAEGRELVDIVSRGLPSVVGHRSKPLELQDIAEPGLRVSVAPGLLSSRFVSVDFVSGLVTLPSLRPELSALTPYPERYVPFWAEVGILLTNLGERHWFQLAGWHSGSWGHLAGDVALAIWHEARRQSLHPRRYLQLAGWQASGAWQDLAEDVSVADSVWKLAQRDGSVSLRRALQKRYSAPESSHHFIASKTSPKNVFS